MIIEIPEAFVGSMRLTPFSSPLGLYVAVWSKPNSWRLSEKGVARHIAGFARQQGIQRIFSIAPSVFAGRVVSGYTLELLSGGVFENLPIPFYRSSDLGVEGVTLEVGDACYVASADCNTIALHDWERCVVFHAGLRSLVWGDPENGIWDPSRQCVVQNALTHLHTDNDKEAYLLGGTTRLVYDPYHPVYGLSNGRLLDSLDERMGRAAVVSREAGLISIAGIAAARLLARRVFCHTFNDLDPSQPGNRDRLWSCGRGERGRNGILVYRSA